MKWQAASLIIGLSTTSCSVLSPGSWESRHSARPIAAPTEAVQRIIIGGTLVSMVKNPATSAYKGLHTLKSRGQIGADHLTRHLTRSGQVIDQSLTVEQALDAGGFPEPIPGEVDYFIDGSFYTEIHRAIGGASKYVDTQVFSFDNDDVAAAYADLLKEKSETVRCRVMMDHLGSVASWWVEPITQIDPDYPPPASMVSYLRKGGEVKVRISRNPWLVADHTKLIIVDGEKAYLGGMNIGREYKHEWHDMMVRVKGPIVTAMQNSFDKAWRLQGPLGDWAYPFRRRAQAYRTTLREGEIPIRILKTTARDSDINDALITAIRVSKERVYLHVSYMTSDQLMRELIRAKKRGVDVRMIFPAKNDSELMNTNNRSCAHDLINAGARVWLYPSSSHTKAVVVDGWTCVGSANLDALSLWINGELNIAFSDKSSVDRLIEDLFEKDFEKSKPLSLEDVEHWSGSPLEFVADQL